LSKSKRGLKELRESLREIWAITKVCLTSFWFWVPVLFSLFLYLELYLLFFYPIICFIILGGFVILALYWEDKRAKAKYGIKDVKVLLSSDPLFTTPRKADSKTEVGKLVDEYKELLKRKKNEDENNDVEKNGS